MSSQCVCVFFFVRGIVDSVLFPLKFLSIFMLFAVVVWYNKKTKPYTENTEWTFCQKRYHK